MSTLTDKYADLDDMLAGPEPDYDSEPEAPRNADDADRMLRKLARLRSELDDVTEVATAQRTRIDQWETAEKTRIGARVAWFEHCLSQYHRAVIATGGAKTLRLPNGVLKAREAPPACDVTDEAAFVKWAQDNAPALIRERPAPAPVVNKETVKKAVKAGELLVLDDGRIATKTGDIAPGVTVLVDRGDTYRQEIAQ